MNRLQQLRMERGVSQGDIAESIGMLRASRTAVGRAERGDYTQPYMRKKLSVYYGKSIEELFDEEGFVIDDGES